MSIKNTELARALGELLSSQGKTITLAESCTGGGIASAITDIPGSSSWFELAWVTYSNDAKHQQLGIPIADIQMHGAVSDYTVKAMLSGALARSGADIGVSVSGIAGPNGGSDDKPVGTVYFAWGGSDDIKTAYKVFTGDRLQIRAQAVGHALTLCCAVLSKKNYTV